MEDCMDATTIELDGKPNVDAVQHLIDGLKRDADSLGKKDDASRSVRDGVNALKTAIQGGGGTVATTLLALEGNVDRLHMSYMRPFFKQTLRALRTALDLDAVYTSKTSVGAGDAVVRRILHPTSLSSHSRNIGGSGT